MSYGKKHMKKGSVSSWRAIRKNDILGKVGKDIVMSDVLAIARTLGGMLGSSHEHIVVIARDGRSTSVRIEEELVRGLVLSGHCVLRLGVVPTSALYFASQVLSIPLAVMVTGSHYAGYYNGFKIVFHQCPLYGHSLQKVIQSCPDKKGLPAQTGRVLEMDIQDAYVKRLFKDFRVTKKFKVVWDFLGGSTSSFARSFLKHIPGEHSVLNGKLKPYSAADIPDPLLLHNTIKVCQTLLEKKADIGFVFDGSGNRFSLCHRDGFMMDPEIILLFFAYCILQENSAGLIIRDMRCSAFFARMVSMWGGHVAFVANGEAPLLEGMQKHHALLGGDAKGRVCIGKDYYGLCDSMYASVCFIIYMEKYSFYRWFSELPRFFMMDEIRISLKKNKISYNHFLDAVCLYLEKMEILFERSERLYIKSQYGEWIVCLSSEEDFVIIRGESDREENLKFLAHDINNCLDAVHHSI